MKTFLRSIGLFTFHSLSTKELHIEAVAVGAILSDYQRVRVENVCNRLSLMSLAYLWRRDQTELLQEMIDCQVHAVLIKNSFDKVASLGLVPDRHLGKSLHEIQPHLLKMRDKYGLNVCGEGGEYETFTLDCPLFKQRIVIDDVQTVISSADPICPVGYINFTKLSLQPKDMQQSCDVIVKKSLDYISDLNESTYSDLSDPDLSETELELIEKETRLRESLSQNELISRSNSFGRHLATSTSPIPIVTKSASVDEHTPLNLLSSSAALCAASLHAGTFGSPRLLGSSTAAVCGSLSLAVSSIGLSAIGTTLGKDGGMSSTTVGGGNGGGTLIFTQPPSPLKYEREFHPLNNRAMVAINCKGWIWVAGIQGCASTLEEGFTKALDSLRSLAVEHNYEMTDYCYVTLYVRSISEYPALNRIYGQALNFQNPPTRVCVECPLPDECHVIIEAIAYKKPQRGRRSTISVNDTDVSSESQQAQNTSINNGELPNKRNTMHVQSISHWAPANIGPYSQSTKINEITYISGQIALVPGSMTIIDGGIRPQCKLTLRHISRIAKAMNAQGQLRDVVHGICFITHPAFIGEARRQWERRTTNAIMDYIVVPALPREALVEWQVWAHTHNDRFEYEETGCSISDYTISIRRRWNYENNCAAIICYVSTGLASSTTQLTQLSEDILNNHRHLAQNLKADHLEEILTYVVNRLLKDYPSLKRSNENLCTSHDGISTTENNVNAIHNCTSNSANVDIILPPAIHLKVFYQVTAAPPVDLLLMALNEYREKCEQTANIVFTVLPACSLHNFSTFLSICGVRHE
uniref:Diphthine--ammonia ligase n=1 Tax=Glossina pallidipes TaxID=7398 RepID=A0A1A9ZLS4_GLOPL